MGEVSYKGCRYPAEIIAHCVWLYHRFPLSFREVEELMLVRGVIVSRETIRQWCAKFGPEYACRLRRRRKRPADKWHLDEVFLTINGRRQICGGPSTRTASTSSSRRRDAKAAKRFFRRLLKRQCASPRVMVTDTLRSYRVAHREVMPSVEHRQSRYLNNRAENSHQPTRQRERAMKRFRSPGGAQRVLSAFSGISPHFRPRRHRLIADDYRTEMTRRFAVWNEVTGLDCRSLTHTTDTQPFLHAPIPLSPSRVSTAPARRLEPRRPDELAGTYGPRAAGRQPGQAGQRTPAAGRGPGLRHGLQP